MGLLDFLIVSAVINGVKKAKHNGSQSVYDHSSGNSDYRNDEDCDGSYNDHDYQDDSCDHDCDW